MINFYEVVETNQMIEEENLDVRTITLGISLMDCIDSDLDRLNENIYKKITTLAKDLVSTGEKIESEFGIPIVNKRISITPVALIGGSACKKPEDFVTIAETLDRAAKEVGVNFIGGYSALVSKGMTKADENLIRSIPKALSVTDMVCSSVNLGSTKTGLDMDAIRLMGEMVHEAAYLTRIIHSWQEHFMVLQKLMQLSMLESADLVLLRRLLKQFMERISKFSVRLLRRQPSRLQEWDSLLQKKLQKDLEYHLVL